MNDKVIVIGNQRGGIGKTSTALALVAAYMRTGDHVLAIDMDPQCNFTQTLGADRTRPGTQDLLRGEAPGKLIQEVQPNLHVLSAHKSMGSAELDLARRSGEYTLKKAIQPILWKYDRIIIDTRPALGMLTINALTAADAVIVPAIAELYSLEGVIDFGDTVGVVRQQANPNLRIEGIVLTRYKGRTNLAKDLSEILQTAAMQLNTKVFNTRIRESNPIAEAQAAGQDIFSYNRRCAGAEDYAALFYEISGRKIDL